MRLQGRRRRHVRLRKKIFGTPERPRLCVRRSLKHIFGCLVDDLHGRTLVTVSTLTPEVRKLNPKGNMEKAKVVGQVLARLAKEKGVEKVTFDRAGYKYHGRVKSLADGARAGGLKF